MCDLLTTLPKDLIDDILFRLPAKPIGRFRCVSKRWQSYLSNPRFARSHVEKSDTNDPENLLCIADHSLYVITFSSKEDDVLRKIKSPFDEFEVGGSCHVLVLLVGNKFGDDKFLINPITLEYEKVIDDGHYDRFVVYGLGYDHSNDDYKIVSLNREGSGGRCVDIYSFKTKLWRRISSFGSLQNHLVYELYKTKDRYEGVFLKGCIHWMAAHFTGSGTRHYISSFDLAREEFEEVVPPRDVELGYVTIRVLGGCLAFMMNYGGDSTDVWVMKEYGVRDSWTKLTFHGLSSYRLYNVVLLLNDHELVLKDKGSFLVIDSRTGGTRKWVDARVPDSGVCTYQSLKVAFRGSLLSPCFGN